MSQVLDNDNVSCQDKMFFNTEEEASAFITEKELIKEKRLAKKLKVSDCKWELQKCNLGTLVKILFGVEVAVVPE